MKAFGFFLATLAAVTAVPDGPVHGPGPFVGGPRPILGGPRPLIAGGPRPLVGPGPIRAGPVLGGPGPIVRGGPGPLVPTRPGPLIGGPGIAAPGPFAAGLGPIGAGLRPIGAGPGPIVGVPRPGTGPVGAGLAPLALGGPGPIGAGPAVVAAHAVPVYRPTPLPAPAYGPAAPAYGEPVYDGPAVYSFTYGVQDDYAGLNFGHSENREGYNTQGTYYVNLPDGRLQTVNYHADEAGYVADVQYSGVAAVPAYAPAPLARPAYVP